MMNKQTTVADTWIMNNKPYYLAPFLAFEIKDTTLFSGPMFEKHVIDMCDGNPSKWWKLMKVQTAKKNLPGGFC